MAGFLSKLLCFIPRRKIAYAIILLLSVLYIFIYLNYGKMTSGHIVLRDSNDENSPVDDRNKTFEESERRGCVHPDLPLWPPGTQKHVSPRPMRCSPNKTNWIYVDRGRFYIDDRALPPHTSVQCNYTPIERVSDFDIRLGDSIAQCNNGTVLPSDFFKVNCTAPNDQTFSSVLSGISEKPDVRDRAKIPLNGTNNLGMNILMFGFDSVSRLMWLRSLPKAHRYFTEELGGVVLEGYNIVGDGTPQALLPILTGETEVELPEARRGFKGAKTVDGHPWIWKDLKKLGYVTQWGEDSPGMGTFTYRMLGFKEQPVDHYLRHFYQASNRHARNEKHCHGSIPSHLNMLNWIRELYHVYPPDRPKFSFVFHAEYTHGSTQKLGLADDDLMEFLETMESDGYLNNTLLILMADHGARFKGLRNTEQGKYEERLPYMGLRMPPWFEEKYPQAMKNLRANIHRLTTPFDIHATFEHLLDFSDPGMGDINMRTNSLFHEIPEERTCAHVGMEAHWCTCLQWEKVSVSDPSAKSAAMSLVNQINNLTSLYRDKCEMLQLENVYSASKYGTNDHVLKFKKSKGGHGRIADLSDNMKRSEELFQLSIATRPGHGQFEATLRYSLPSQMFLANEREISRINRYGSHPHCVADQHPHLRPYCYCKTQLPDS